MGTDLSKNSSFNYQGTKPKNMNVFTVSITIKMYQAVSTNWVVTTFSANKTERVKETLKSLLILSFKAQTTRAIYFFLKQ